VELEAQKAANAQGVRRTPRDRTLGVETFEVPQQQHAEIPARLEAGTAHAVGVKPLAQRLDVSIKVGVVENLIQPRVERMRGAARQVLRGHPYRCLRRTTPSFAHRHRR